MALQLTSHDVWEALRAGAERGNAGLVFRVAEATTLLSTDCAGVHRFTEIESVLIFVNLWTRGDRG